MFEGTDLSMAYGSMYETPAPAGPAGSPMAPEEGPVAPNQRYAQKNPSTYAREDLSRPSPYPEAAPPAQQPPAVSAMAPAPVMAAAPAPLGVGGYSFWDRLAARKMEVYKVFAFSLVIVLAVAIHSVASHYLNQYVGQAFLSDLQEFLVRLSYPVLVILVIWVMKAW